MKEQIKKLNNGMDPNTESEKLTMKYPLLILKLNEMPVDLYPQPKKRPPHIRQMSTNDKLDEYKSTHELSDTFYLDGHIKRYIFQNNYKRKQFKMKQDDSTFLKQLRGAFVKPSRKEKQIKFMQNDILQGKRIVLDLYQDTYLNYPNLQGIDDANKQIQQQSMEQAPENYSQIKQSYEATRKLGQLSKSVGIENQQNYSSQYLDTVAYQCQSDLSKEIQQKLRTKLNKLRLDHNQLLELEKQKEKKEEKKIVVTKKYFSNIRFPLVNYQKNMYIKSKYNVIDNKLQTGAVYINKNQQIVLPSCILSPNMLDDKKIQYERDVIDFRHHYRSNRNNSPIKTQNILTQNDSQYRSEYKSRSVQEVTEELQRQIGIVQPSQLDRIQILSDRSKISIRKSVQQIQN